MRSVFCFFTRFALISAGSPIHSSNPNSAVSRSNQREYSLVASIPTRTLSARLLQVSMEFFCLVHHQWFSSGVPAGTIARLFN